MTTGRRRALGIGVLLALAVEPPLLLPLISAAPQLGPTPLPPLSAPSNDSGVRTSPQPPATGLEIASEQQRSLPESLKALLSWGSVAVAPQPVSGRQTPD